MSDDLAFEARIDGPFEAATARVEDALKQQGFGVLTRIDVKKTLKEKLDVDFPAYAILGACNPRLAHRALSARPEVGLLLPCNVTLEEGTDGTVTVRIADPAMMMGVGGFEQDERVAGVAADAGRLLRQVAHALRGPGGEA